MLVIADAIFIILVSLFLSFLVSNNIKDRKALFLIFFSSIFLHELAHKAVAYRFGYVSYITSELSLPYLLLTTVIYLFMGVLIPPPIYTRVFAINVDGALAYTTFNILRENAREIAMISVAGPLANLLLSILAFLVLKLKLYNNEYEKGFFDTLAKFNLMLFAINMLPVFIGADGYIFLEAIRKII